MGRLPVAPMNPSSNRTVVRETVLKAFSTFSCTSTLSVAVLRRAHRERTFRLLLFLFFSSSAQPWKHPRVPDAWHMAFVAAVFKNGDARKSDNYRPTSLLAVGYKLFARIPFRPLKDARSFYCS